MRLFTALWPPADVLDALEDSHAEIAGWPGWRPVPRERWHVTLAFHGEDDPDRRATRLEALTGASAPRLRLGGTGTFPGVVWAGVEILDRAAMDDLVTGAGGDPGTFVGHLTLARRSGRGCSAPDLPDVPPGPWWVPEEVLLVASERLATGLRYRLMHRVRLRPAGADAAD